MKTYYYIGYERDSTARQMMVLRSVQLDPDRVESKGDYERVRIPSHDTWGTSYFMIIRSELYEDPITVLWRIANQTDNIVAALEDDLKVEREHAITARANLMEALGKRAANDGGAKEEGQENG